jgi:acetyl-CoA carboxylase, biotin carboxylase subunit
MFRKILIANRGEIAVRIIHTCRELGISPIAIYSEPDVTSLHVRLADEAYCVGAAPSVESYLSIKRIVDVAKESGAEAVHPGYGFLAENALFARAVKSAGLVFIGPPAEVIELMGSKTGARRQAIASGVPVVPGTVEALKSYDEARFLAEELGYPIMLKASAGGGGKGMRLVASEEELLSAFETVQSEAAAAFNDPQVYIEKVVEKPRHIEIQIFADTHGNYVHLGERECSIQRRHQKVIEECPSPIKDVELRDRMGKAAVDLARATGYVGAGTVEFLVSDSTREFYFLEMNTRLQVEHAVTEMVTGIDLVREQIQVASGASLSFCQEDIGWYGHAIECRIYAEDSDNNFLPSPGRIVSLRVPSNPFIRNDSGIYEGSEVLIYYDPMISKLVSWGRTREESIDRMRSALDQYTIIGIKTNLPFFRSIIRDQEFIDGKLDAGFIERFNKRSQKSVVDELVHKDIAAIVAALTYERPAVDQPQMLRQRKWKVAGRLSQLSSRNV